MPGAGHPLQHPALRRFPDPVHVGLIVSHDLVARYLCDILKKLDENLVPIVLSPYSAESIRLLPQEGKVIVLVDLVGLPCPYVEYLNVLLVAAPQCTFIAMDRGRPVLEVARLVLAGFSGYLTYEAIPSDLGKALQVVSDEQIWASREVMRAYRDLTLRRLPRTETPAGAITQRENQVLELLRRRYANKEVAQMLQISESTVKFHVSNILNKLNVSRRRDLFKSEALRGWNHNFQRKRAKCAQISNLSSDSKSFCSIPPSTSCS
jgi:two-component system, NarL family, response regulator LiaR